MKIISTTKEELSKTAGEKLVSLVPFETPVLLLLSGGSALGLLEHAHKILDHTNISVGMLDDRATQNEDNNNFCAMLETPFGLRLVEKRVPVIDTHMRSKESPTQMARRFADSLMLWRKNNPKGCIVATMGVGEDGHTAGIFPFPDSPRLSKELFEDDEWVACYDAHGKHEVPLRVTVTHTFLTQEVDHALVYVSGENKKDALSRICTEEGDIIKTPARIIREMQDVCVVTDIPTQTSQGSVA